MKNSRIILVLSFVFCGLFAHAQDFMIEMLEIGVQAGGGLVWGNNTPMSGVVRQPAFAINAESQFPAMETYGGMLRYSAHERFAVQIQAMAERVHFGEQLTSEKGNSPMYYYNNTLCNLDATVEFNFMKYGFQRSGDEYTIVPYASTGLGVSIYNQNATFAWKSTSDGSSKFNTAYPGIKGDLGTAMYVPFGLGVKMRLAVNWQLRLACQYNMYVAGKDKMVDIYGATYADKNTVTVRENNSALSDQQLINTLDFTGRPTYEDLKNAYAGQSAFANNHNLLITLGIVFNFADQYKGLIIEY